jgi:SAM-dependent methyltransferase
MTNPGLLSFACRACGSAENELVLDLGLQPLANNLLRADDLAKPEPRFPLRLAVCHRCWLLQIADLVPPVSLFSEYLYFSSFSDAMLRHAATAAAEHVAEFGLDAKSFVVEVASNDGYLLKNFVERGIPCLGIEPAANVAAVARERGIDTLGEFFGLNLAQKLAAEGRTADLILGNNVFAHVPDTNDFVAGLQALLRPGGRVVLEFPYGGDFIDQCEFDTIYHEHFFYFFLTPVLELLSKHGLEVFHVARLPIHGGSLRLFAGRAGEHPVRPDVAALRAHEEQQGVRGSAFYRNFSARAHTLRQDLLGLLAELKGRGRRIAAYGASAKGSTLLNFVQPSPSMFEFMADRNTYKQDRFSPGLHVPIVAAEELLARQPDYTLLLTWNFADEILAQQAEYRTRGGKFIVPIPQVAVL